MTLHQLQSSAFQQGGLNNGGKIGTARLRYLEEDGDNHKAYLFDIQMDAGKSFRNTKTIARADETFQYAKVVLENSKCVLKESQKVNNYILHLIQDLSLLQM